MTFDYKRVQDEITTLMLQYPQLVDDDVLREDMVEGSTSMDDFIRDLLRKIGSTEALRESTKVYIDELELRRARMQHRVDALRALILKILQHANLKSRELPEGTVSIRNGTAKVIVVDEQQLPSEFVRIKKEPDKHLIKAALLAHEQVPGACLSNAEPHLSIRTS